jgi:osmotically-inducible protein OsmY
MTRTQIVARHIPVLCLVAGLTVATGASAAPSADLTNDVRQRLAAEELVGFAVAVETSNTEVILRGEVPSLWHREWAIERASKTDGVVSVVSYLTIRDADGPRALANAVAEAIRRYEYYTVFDYVSGEIVDSVVTLRGVVTARPDKPGDLRERVSRVAGVKGVVIELEILSPAIGDERLRAALARRIYGTPTFSRYLGLDPSIHLIVRNGYVTLKGAVLTQGDRVQVEAVARRTFGVIRVDNQLRTKAELMKKAVPDKAPAEPDAPVAVVAND